MGNQNALCKIQQNTTLIIKFPILFRIMEKRITQQIQIYNSLKQAKTQLDNTIQHQEKIKKFHTLPKQYQPKKLAIAEPNDGKLRKKFEGNYKTIFFEHLQEVITANKITLELKTARLYSIVRNTEIMLIESKETN